MANPLDIKPASSLAVLLTATYGDPASPTVRRYTSWTSNIILGSETFTSEPTLDVSLGRKDGSTEDNPTKVTISYQQEPFDRLVLPFRHSKVKIKIEQIDPFDVSTRVVEYVGTVDIVRKNPNGRRGNLCEVQLFGVKYRLGKAVLSLPMNTRCDNRFGGRLCRVDASAWDRVGTVTSVGSPRANSVVLNLTGISDPATQLPNDRYENGAVVVQGLAIPIKRSLATGTFELAMVPPPWWEGEACKVFAGCNHKLTACRIWDNEINFNGRGCKIPARNPVFELPAD